MDMYFVYPVGRFIEGVAELGKLRATMFAFMDIITNLCVTEKLLSNNKKINAF